MNKSISINTSIGYLEINYEESDVDVKKEIFKIIKDNELSIPTVSEIDGICEISLCSSGINKYNEIEQLEKLTSHLPIISIYHLPNRSENVIKFRKSFLKIKTVFWNNTNVIDLVRYLGMEEKLVELIKINSE